QQPPGFRTSGAPQCGHATFRRSGTARTLAYSSRSEKSGAASPESLPPRMTGGCTGSVAARLAEFLALIRPEGHHVPTTRRALLQRMEPAPQIVGVDVEHVADVLKREEPAAVGIFDPLLGLAKELAAARILRPGLLAIDVDRVLEDGDHQAPLAIVLAAPAHAVEELRREERVGLEEPAEPLVDCVFTIFHLSSFLTWHRVLVLRVALKSGAFLQLCLRRGGRCGIHDRRDRPPDVRYRSLFEEFHHPPLPLSPHALHATRA